MQKAIGFFGESGSGKTTLIERLIERFGRAGLRVAAIKHAHHGFDIDRPGKDSYRFRAAGAAQVLIASDQRWALLSDETPDAGSVGALARQMARFDPCDLVLVEGYRGQAGIPFIHVQRKPQGPEDGAAAVRDAGRQEAARQGEVAGLIAVASDVAVPSPARAGVALLDLNDIEAIARFICVQLEVKLC